MFTTGQKVTCIDADNQPRLQEGKEYTVWDVEGERGIRVETESGRIRYSFNIDRFEAVPVAGPVVADSNYGWADAVIVINGNSVYTADVRRDGDDNIIEVRNSLPMSEDI